MKKIEHNILIFILIEAVFTLFFYKLNIIEIIIGCTLGIILILLSNLIPKNTLFKIRLFISSIIIGIYTLIKISNFIKYNILPSHSLIIILICFLLLSVYLVTKGYHTFIKTVEITSYIFIVIKIISFILIIPKINISNIYNITIDISNYRFIYFGVAICLIYNSIYYITNNKPSIKIIGVSLINILLIKIIDILILGNKIADIYNYPYISSLKKIKYLDFIERCDGVLSFEFLISFYILLTFIFLNTKLLYNKKSQKWDFKMYFEYMRNRVMYKNFLVH